MAPRRRNMSRTLASLIAGAARSAAVAAAARTSPAAPSCFLGSSSAARRYSALGRTAAAAATATTTPGPRNRRRPTARRDAARLYVATRKSYRRRQADKAAARGAPATDGELDWEKFDYSLNPKLDKRFNDDIRNDDSVKYEDLVSSEAAEDVRDRRALNDLNDAYRSLDPDLVDRATSVLLPYVNEDRVGRIDSVLSARTKRTKFLFENPSNPSNVWACLRTIDSFGVQNVDVVIETGRYEGKMAIQQKRGMRTAMGSAKWLSLRNHASAEEAVERIRAEGYRIYASDLNPSSRDVREVDWDAGPVCVVMGNEDRGISEEMRAAADQTFTLPMCGFAESFNLSVATAVTLAHMSARSKDGVGPLRPGDLDPHEVACLRLKGLLGSLPQRRTGPLLLKKEGIELPESLRLI